MEYKIYEGNMERLEKKILSYQNKFNRMGAELSYNIIGEEFIDFGYYTDALNYSIYNNISMDKAIEKISFAQINKENMKPLHDIRRFVIIDVSGKFIINDWEFVAKLQNQEGQNIIKKIVDIDVPEIYFNRTICDHCGVNRYRSETFLLRNKNTLEFKQVGRTCLRDFIGIDVEDYCKFLALFDNEALFDIPVDGGGSNYICIQDYLLYVVELVRLRGYIPKYNKDGEYNSDSTINTALDFYKFCDKSYSTRKAMENLRFVADTQANKNAVELILDWIKNLDCGNNEYYHNLQVICNSDYTKFNNIGLLTSIVIAKQKFDEKILAQKEKNLTDGQSEFVGNIGERIIIENATFKYLTGYDTQYGFVFIYKIVSDNNIFIWKTHTIKDFQIIGSEKESNILPNGIKYIVEGSLLTIKGTVKAHNEFRGIKQTELTRCSIIEGLTENSLKQSPIWCCKRKIANCNFLTCKDCPNFIEEETEEYNNTMDNNKKNDNEINEALKIFD